MTYDILSERGYMHWASWDVVYEWEDIIAKNSGCKIVTFRTGIKGKFIRRGIRDINKLCRKEQKYRITDKERIRLLFVMSAAVYKDLPTKNIIPVFLDFPEKMVEVIIRATNELPVFFVTCKDIYNILKEKGLENVRYMPLSISDRYYRQEIPDKSIDVIQFGRKNKILHDYMLRYCKEHRGTEYVYQTRDGSLTYLSTTRGNIGRFNSRKEYMDLIRTCRCSLVSSPGCDRGRSDEFGKIDFITPRFYESAACYCHLIGRYTENEESREIGISEICPCVSEYAQFEEILDNYLCAEEYDWSKQKKFVAKNVTSNRVDYLKKVLDSIIW